LLVLTTEPYIAIAVSKRAPGALSELKQSCVRHTLLLLMFLPLWLYLLLLFLLLLLPLLASLFCSHDFSPHCARRIVCTPGNVLTDSATTPAPDQEPIPAASYEQLGSPTTECLVVRGCPPLGYRL
jgi:hypothetical protein